MAFLFGLVIGFVIGSVIFIIFGKNNKNKIAAAREELINLANKAEGQIKEEINKLQEKIK